MLLRYQDKPGLNPEVSVDPVIPDLSENKAAVCKDL